MVACGYSFDGWQCPLQGHAGGATCILHLGHNNDADQRWTLLSAYVKTCVDAKRDVILHGMQIVDAYPLRAALEAVPVRGKAVTFYRSVDFEGLSIPHHLQLQRCRFLQGASFRKCTFASHVEMDHAEINDVLRMQHCKFAHILGLEDSRLVRGFYVEHVEFSGLHLRRAQLGSLVMRNVTHSKGLLLQRMEVSGTVAFERCRLDTKIMWGGAHLAKSIRVSDCVLDGHWLGDGATVVGSYEVARLQLNGRMDFQGATFGGSAAFRDIHMGAGARANFTAARFHGEAVFENWDDPDTADPSIRALVVFSRVPVLAESRFKFRGVSKDDTARPFRIRMFSFLHTDVSGFRFGNVDWMQNPAWLTWRQRQINAVRKRLGLELDEFRVARVVDEDFLTHRPGQEAPKDAPWRADASLVADLYRDLRQAYESRGSYHEAGQFHVREMEMRRLSRMNPHSHKARAAVERGVLNMYRAFSLYGESYTRPLAWLGGLLALAWGWHALTAGRLEEFRVLPHHVAFVEGLHVLFPFLRGGLIDAALRILAITVAALLVMALRRAFMRHS